MKRKTLNSVGRFVFAVGLGLVLTAPYAANAAAPILDSTNSINIVGSTHGQNYQGAAQPLPGQAAYATPLSLCNQSPRPQRYQNKTNLQDQTNAQVTIPAGNIVLWVCDLKSPNSGTNFTFRYTGGFSAMAYNNMLAPYTLPPGSPNPASLFTTVLIDGTCGAVTANGATGQVANPQTDPGTGMQYDSFINCNTPALVQADFGTSDSIGSAFASTICDPYTLPNSCATPIADIGVQSFPITATPFVVIVGNGVQKSSGTGPGCGSSAGPITLSRLQIEAIFNGQVTSWNQLGYCVYQVQTVSNAQAVQFGVATDAGFQPTVGTAFNAAIPQNIYTCSRPNTAGTRVIFDSAFMKNSTEISFGSIGPPFDNTDTNWLAPTVANGLTCVQGASSGNPAVTSSHAHNNGITYNRADEGASPVAFSVGNVGRMLGGYPVVVDGTLPSNYTPPLSIPNPTDAERAASQKDFRCGRYAFWSDWIGYQRTVGAANPNLSLWNQYVDTIGTSLPKSTAGFFWARNVHRPGAAVNSEMSISEGSPTGPILYNTGTNSACF